MKTKSYLRIWKRGVSDSQSLPTRFSREERTWLDQACHGKLLVRGKYTLFLIATTFYFKNTISVVSLPTGSNASFFVKIHKSSSRS